MKVYTLRPWRPLHRLRGPPPPLWQGRLEVRSVPLRGYGFEIFRGLGKEGFNMKDVSVPLRGYGFEMKCLLSNHPHTLHRFRPLAGIWF